MLQGHMYDNRQSWKETLSSWLWSSNHHMLGQLIYINKPNFIKDKHLFEWLKINSLKCLKEANSSSYERYVFWIFSTNSRLNNCKIVQNSHDIPHPASPNVNILYKYSIMVRTQKFTLVQYKQNKRSYSNFNSFSTKALFLCQDPT